MSPESNMTVSPLLEISNLSVAFGSDVVAKGLSFAMERGKTMALVGESGSGKSVTALSILRLLPYPNANHPDGRIAFDGRPILGTGDDPWRMEELRGNRIAMIFQEPMTSLNPLHTIGRQVGEVLRLHKGMDEKAASARVLELLRLVALPDPEKRVDAYPHELSGGQRQRVMIAMALANNPDILIADEPTTALDVTIQAQILDLLKDLQGKLGMAILLITHDLGIVRKMADGVCVMRRGEIVEQGETAELFAAPRHEYTKMLLASEPKGLAEAIPDSAVEVVRAEGVKVHFPIRKGLLRRAVDYVRAVDGVSFAVRAGETVGVVGESGSGKTTLGLAVLRLLSGIKPEGAVAFMGKTLGGANKEEMRRLRRSMQIVFQDPYGSLSPRMTAGDIVAEGLDIHGLAKSPEDRVARIDAILNEVGLDASMRDRYPHEFSGGQRQRLAIARAMILKPKFVVLDEPTSALDMSVQAQIVELLRGLQRAYGLAYMFISHDLRVVRAMSNHVIVMKGGQVVEQGAAETVFSDPRHEYTRKLLGAALAFSGSQTRARAFPD